MEPADDDRQAGLPQRARNVQSARKLVRLHADKRNEPEAAVTLQQGAIRFGLMRVLISSRTVRSISTLGPSTRRVAQSSAIE